MSSDATSPAGGPSPLDLPGLDLRAIERDLHQTWPDGQGLHVMYEHATALFIHVRALRAALQRVVDDTHPPWQYDELRALLSGVSDGASL